MRIASVGETVAKDHIGRLRTASLLLSLERGGVVYKWVRSEGCVLCERLGKAKPQTAPEGRRVEWVARWARQ